MCDPSRYSITPAEAIRMAEKTGTDSLGEWMRRALEILESHKKEAKNEG